MEAIEEKENNPPGMCVKVHKTSPNSNDNWSGSIGGTTSSSNSLSPEAREDVIQEIDAMSSVSKLVNQSEDHVPSSGVEEDAGRKECGLTEENSIRVADKEERDVEEEISVNGEEEEADKEDVAEESSINEVLDLDEEEADKEEDDEAEESSVNDYVDVDEEEVEKERRHLAELEELRSDQELREERYRQLLVLLNKSELYVQIIQRRMEEDRARAAEREARRERKMVEKEDSGSVRRSKRVAATREDGDATPIRQSRGRPRKRPEPTTPSPRGSLGGPAKRRKMNDSQDSTASSTSTEKGSLKPDEDEVVTGDLPQESEASIEGLLLLNGGTLRSYQREGYKWLISLFENGMNGILADEMGLGKTVQVIASICHFVQRGVGGPFLVLAPLSTLPNWAIEFKRFAPRIPVVLYHGTPVQREELRRKIDRPINVVLPDGHRVPVHDGDDKVFGPGDCVATCPVVVTSYEMIIRDFKFLQRFHFKTLAVDEGHRLKNHSCRLFSCLKHFHTSLRILLTGTPLQNNLAELWSLLNFILPDVFYSLATFETWFDPTALTQSDGHERLIAEEQERAVVTTMHQILSPFLLRRLKADVDLAVPPKREILIYARMSSTQQELYKQTADRTIDLLLGKRKMGMSKVDVENILEMSRRENKPKKTYEEAESDDEFDEYEEDSEEEEEETGRRKGRRSSTAVEKSKSVATPQREICLQMRNCMMLFRRIVNHPYLVDYPLDEEGEYLLTENLVEESGKMRVLDRLLNRLKESGHKVLIFSQMTSILDLIQDYHNMRGWRYSRLDGSMSLETRREQLNWFQEDPSIFSFLLSARAGGLGLNLTAADTVIIFDSDWNPQTDIQAQDRCHRIGQTRPVLIFRLVVANTIDQKIIDRATAKRSLEKLIIHRKKFKGSAARTGDCDRSANGLPKVKAMNRQELIELLAQRDYEREMEADWLTDEVIEQLLDRSDLYKRWKQSQNDQSEDEVHKHPSAADGKKLPVKEGVCRILDDEESHILGSLVAE